MLDSFIFFGDCCMNLLHKAEVSIFFLSVGGPVGNTKMVIHLMLLIVAKSPLPVADEITVGEIPEKVRFF